MNINLHIERLVLEGLRIGSGQGRQVKAAVETELTRLLAEEGLNQSLLSGRALAAVRAEGIQTVNEGSPATLGRQIAQAVYGGISK